MMLDHLGASKAAVAIEAAVVAAVEKGKCTSDVGGSLGTSATGDAVAAAVAAA